MSEEEKTELPCAGLALRKNRSRNEGEGVRKGVKRRKQEPEG